MTHKCFSKRTIIGKDNGLSPGRRRANIWTNAGILLIGPLRANFSEILMEIYIFSFKENAFELVVRNLAAILFRSQCVNNSTMDTLDQHQAQRTSLIARFMGPTWGPPGSCRPQAGPMLAPWILLSGRSCWQPLLGLALRKSLLRWPWVQVIMTSWNENAFRVAGPFWGETTGHRWIPLTKDQWRSFKAFFGGSLSKLLNKLSISRWFATPYDTHMTSP